MPRRRAARVERVPARPLGIPGVPGTETRHLGRSRALARQAVTSLSVGSGQAWRRIRQTALDTCSRWLPQPNSGTVPSAVGPEWERRCPARLPQTQPQAAGLLRRQGADVRKRSGLSAMLPRALSSHRGGQGFKSPQLHANPQVSALTWDHAGVRGSVCPDSGSGGVRFWEPILRRHALRDAREHVVGLGSSRRVDVSLVRRYVGLDDVT
jgi:hypothetical protein